MEIHIPLHSVQPSPYITSQNGSVVFWLQRQDLWPRGCEFKSHSPLLPCSKFVVYCLYSDRKRHYKQCCPTWIASL